MEPRQVDHNRFNSGFGPIERDSKICMVPAMIDRPMSLSSPNSHSHAQAGPAGT